MGVQELNREGGDSEFQLGVVVNWEKTIDMFEVLMIDGLNADWDRKACLGPGLPIDSEGGYNNN